MQVSRSSHVQAIGPGFPLFAVLCRVVLVALRNFLDLVNTSCSPHVFKRRAHVGNPDAAAEVTGGGLRATVLIM